MKQYELIVVGGGAAGLLAAGFAAKEGLEVLVAEKMERPARKILVTGKGRCNLTNNCDQEYFFSMVKSNPRFLYSAYSGFTAQDTMALFESLGIPLETQRGNRVFPKTEKAMDIADGLVRFAKTSGAAIRRLEVTALLLDQGAIAGVATTNGEKLLAKRVLVATGGKSYPGTGSTGTGYLLARQVGHSVTDLRPSLVAMETVEDWPKEAMGLSLRNVELRLLQGEKKKPVFQEQGEMLFTHFGVSGPLVLSASAHMSKAASEYRLEIDLKPGLTVEQLDGRVLRDFGEFTNRDFDNALGELLPRALIPVVVALSGIPHYTKVNQITKEQRDSLVALLKGLPLTPKTLRPIEEAVVTAGGVSVKEVNPKTMESKLVPGLYFAGELLDLDAYTGGFNLQIAFSTGHAAGIGTARSLGEEIVG